MDGLLRYQGFGEGGQYMKPALAATHLATWTAGRLLPDQGFRETRFRRMGAAPRASVVVGELTQHIVLQEPAHPDATATLALRARNGSSVLPLLRLTPPPYGVFQAQLDTLLSRAAERERRASEILLQVKPADAFWASIVGLRSDNHRWTAEFLNCALDFTMFVLFRFKQAFIRPRPFEYTAQIQPILQTPGHDSWPSGHATEAHLIARVLSTLATLSARTHPADVEIELWKLAHRIARNREVAGLHFPTDTTAGKVLGDTLAVLLMGLSEADDSPAGFHCRNLDAPAFYAALGNGADEGVTAAGFDAFIKKREVPIRLAWRTSQAPQLTYLPILWRLAKAEWGAKLK
jgi:hypothetical protein